MKTLGVFVISVMCLLQAACGEQPRTTGISDDGRVTAETKENNNALIQISVPAQQRIGILVTPAQAARLPEILRLSGSVQPIDSKVTRIRPLARGRITEVAVRLGERVAAKQLLARFDNVEAGDLFAQHAAARAELAKLRVQQAATERQAERYRNLAAIGAVPQKELEAIEAERQGQLEAIRAQESTVAGLKARLRRFGLPDTATSDDPSNTTIRSPFSGVVTAIQAAPGEVVDTASELFAIADLTRVYVAGQVYEKDLGQVEVGQPATIFVPAYPDAPFSGRVASTSAVLDPQTRTAAVRIEVINAEARLRLDMFANVELRTSPTRKVLAIPADAIQQIDGKPVVFIRQDSTHFIARPIQTGTTTEKSVEVKAGLKPGDPVVTKGAFEVKSVLLGKNLGEGDDK